MIPRQEPNLVISSSTSQDGIYSTSPLSDYSATVPEPEGPDANRRSTGASEALQYYWSSSAGERNGSVGSNLGLSPIDTSAGSQIATSPYSPYSLSSPHPLAPPRSASPLMVHAKSDVSLRELVEEEEEHARQRGVAGYGRHAVSDTTLPSPRLGGTPRDHETSEAGQSNRRIHLVSYPSDGSIPQASGVHRPSSRASSNSGESEYSLPDENVPERPAPKREGPAGPAQQPVIQRRISPMSQQRPRGLVDAEGRLDVLLDPSFEDWAQQRAWEGPGDGRPKSSSAPVSSTAAAPPGTAAERWPPSSSSIIDRRRAGRTPSPPDDRTPRNSTIAARSETQTPRSSLPKSGRLLFVAPADVSRQSVDALEREAREANGLGLDTTRGSRVGLSIIAAEHTDPEMPRSAPAIKTGFGDIGLPETRRPTSLLPAPKNSSAPQERKLSAPNGSPMLGARRSPEPPPRSELRKQRTRTPTPPGASIVVTACATPTSLTSPANVNNNNNNNNIINTPPNHSDASKLSHTEGGLRTHTLPTIINTPNTPGTSPQHAGRSARGPSPRAQTAPLPATGTSPQSVSPLSASMTESTTIQDLTKILGAAIDEIGLIDSRDTPPPNVVEPPKPRVPLTLSQVPVRSASNHAGAVQVQTPEQQFNQLSPTGASLQGTSPTNGRGNMLGASPMGSLGLMSTVGASVAAAGNAASQRTGSAVRHVRKASSILSLRSSNYSHMSPTASTFSAGSLPNAVLFGTIKQLKTPGDRARAYAHSTAELQRSDSGLREWLYPQFPLRPAMSRPKPSGQANLGLGFGLLAPAEQQQRVVSGGSEFPMRVDAYSARELSVRNLEPADAPTALPSNLPYPQLQHHVKGSNSMQSLTSLSSYKPQPRGLGRAFNFLKRDKENASLASLGPANPQAFTPSMSAPKRELRNMPISGPYSPAAGRSSLDSIDGQRVQPSLAVPRGPREAPGRASHDAQRNSLDRALGSLSLDRQRSPVPGPGGAGLHGASPLAQRDHNAPSDEEVRAMAEMLPHGERAVLRAYLQTYGEPSYALTAYIEDEKNGTLMRAAS